MRDGEGATKFVSINVKNTPTYEQAHAIASSISTSALVKCALHGADANWGRILCAVGYTRLPGNADDTSAQEWRVDPAKVTVKFVPPATLSAEERKTVVDELVVLKDGVPQQVDEDKAAHLLSFEDIDIVVDLQGGSAGLGAGHKMEQATYWTCDFSKVSCDIRFSPQFAFANHPARLHRITWTSTARIDLRTIPCLYPTSSHRNHRHVEHQYRIDMRMSMIHGVADACRACGSETAINSFLTSDSGLTAHTVSPDGRDGCHHGLAYGASL